MILLFKVREEFPFSYFYVNLVHVRKLGYNVANLNEQ